MTAAPMASVGRFGPCGPLGTPGSYDTETTDPHRGRIQPETLPGSPQAQQMTAALRTGRDQKAFSFEEVDRYSDHMRRPSFALSSESISVFRVTTK